MRKKYLKGPKYSLKKKNYNWKKHITRTHPIPNLFDEEYYF